MIERITLRFENGEINNLTEEMKAHIEDARRSLLGHYTGKGVPESHFASRMSMDADVLVWQGFMNVGGGPDDLTKEFSKYGKKTKKSEAARQE